MPYATQVQRLGDGSYMIYYNSIIYYTYNIIYYNQLQYSIVCYYTIYYRLLLRPREAAHGQDPLRAPPLGHDPEEPRGAGPAHHEVHDSGRPDKF